MSPVVEPLGLVVVVGGGGGREQLSSLSTPSPLLLSLAVKV